jgi:hypothetical protein
VQREALEIGDVFVAELGERVGAVEHAPAQRVSVACGVAAEVAQVGRARDGQPPLGLALGLRQLGGNRALSGGRQRIAAREQHESGATIARTWFRHPAHVTVMGREEVPVQLARLALGLCCACSRWRAPRCA